MGPRGKLIASRNIAMNVYQADREHGSIDAVFMDPHHLIRLDLGVHLPPRTITRCDVEYVTHPYDVCPSVAERGALLVGLVIGRGIRREVASRLGGVQGCAHLRELATETINLAASALVGYDQGFGLMSASFNRKPPEERHRLSLPVLRGSCAAYVDAPPAADE